MYKVAHASRDFWVDHSTEALHDLITTALSAVALHHGMEAGTSLAPCARRRLLEQLWLQPVVCTDGRGDTWKVLRCLVVEDLKRRGKGLVKLIWWPNGSADGVCGVDLFVPLEWLADDNEPPKVGKKPKQARIVVPFCRSDAVDLESDIPSIKGTSRRSRFSRPTHPSTPHATTAQPKQAVPPAARSLNGSAQPSASPSGASSSKLASLPAIAPGPSRPALPPAAQATARTVTFAVPDSPGQKGKTAPTTPTPVGTQIISGNAIKGPSVAKSAGMQTGPAGGGTARMAPQGEKASLAFIPTDVVRPGDTARTTGVSTNPVSASVSAVKPATAPAAPAHARTAPTPVRNPASNNQGSIKNGPPAVAVARQTSVSGSAARPQASGSTPTSSQATGSASGSGQKSSNSTAVPMAGGPAVNTAAIPFPKAPARIPTAATHQAASGDGGIPNDQSTPASAARHDKIVSGNKSTASHAATATATATGQQALPRPLSQAGVKSAASSAYAPASPAPVTAATPISHTATAAAALAPPTSGLDEVSQSKAKQIQQVSIVVLNGAQQGGTTIPSMLSQQENRATIVPAPPRAEPINQEPKSTAGQQANTALSGHSALHPTTKRVRSESASGERVDSAPADAMIEGALEGLMQSEYNGHKKLKTSHSPVSEPLDIPSATSPSARSRSPAGSTFSQLTMGSAGRAESVRNEAAGIFASMDDSLTGILRSSLTMQEALEDHVEAYLDRKKNKVETAIRCGPRNIVALARNFDRPRHLLAGQSVPAAHDISPTTSSQKVRDVMESMGFVRPDEGAVGSQAGGLYNFGDLFGQGA